MIDIFQLIADTEQHVKDGLISKSEGERKIAHIKRQADDKFKRACEKAFRPAMGAFPVHKD